MENKKKDLCFKIKKGQMKLFSFKIKNKNKLKFSKKKLDNHKKTFIFEYNIFTKFILNSPFK
jgi:hypothetical protein